MPTPVELGYRMPAEWHRHSATWLSWPKDPETWPGRVPQVEEIFLKMMAALAPHETVNLLVDDEETEASVRTRSTFPGAENIHYHRIPTVDSWVRDYGPNFLLSNQMYDPLQFVGDSGKKPLNEANHKLKEPLNKWSTPWSAAARRRFGQRRLVAASLNQLKQAWPRQVATGQSAARPAHSKELSHP